VGVIVDTSGVVYGKKINRGSYLEVLIQSEGIVEVKGIII
jgi:hypothetical protein